MRVVGENLSKLNWRGAARALLAGLALLLLLPAPVAAQSRTEIVPDVWRGDVLRPKPDLHGLDKLRFITDNDYPPFHYFDEVGALTGLNVDLAKAICEALEVECDVQPVDCDDLFTALDRDEA